MKSKKYSDFRGEIHTCAEFVVVFPATKKYSDFRAEIRTGDLIFTASDSIFSRIIRFFTRSAVSHVGVFFWDGDRLFVAESVEGAGVRIIHASMLFRSGSRVFWGRPRRERCSHEEYMGIHLRIGSLYSYFPLGTDYDMRGALGFLWSKGKNALPYCAEYAEYVLGISSPARRRNSTPDDLAALCGEDFFELKK